MTRKRRWKEKFRAPDKERRKRTWNVSAEDALITWTSKEFKLSERFRLHRAWWMLNELFTKSKLFLLFVWFCTFCSHPLNFSFGLKELQTTTTRPLRLSKKLFPQWCSNVYKLHCSTLPQRVASSSSRICHVTARSSTAHRGITKSASSSPSGVASARLGCL